MSRRPALIHSVPVKRQSQGSWNRVSLHTTGLGAGTVLYMTLHDARGTSLVGDLYLYSKVPDPSSSEQSHDIICFIPAETAEARITVAGPATTFPRAVVTMRPMSRAMAMAQLLRHVPPGSVRALLRESAFHPHRLPSRLRRLLAVTATGALLPRQDYPTWVALFDQWAEVEFPQGAATPSIAYLVSARDRSSPALAATLASLEDQYRAPAKVVVVDSLPEPDGLPEADYIGLLQAGEVLSPHTTLLAAEQIERLGRPEVVTSDDDDLGARGERHSPRFRPTANHAMMLSGLLSRGLWFVRRPTVLRHAPAGATWAETCRLGLWLNRYRHDPAPFSARLPYILSHRRPDTEAAPPEPLAEIVARHLEGGGPAMAPHATWPITFSLRHAPKAERVTAIVPSTLRQPHSLECIRAVLDGTDHPGLEVHVSVMQPGPLDEAQQAAAEAISRYPNATVTWIEAPRFNFSTANNRIAERTSGDLILLLNDDVSPIRPDWLRWMSAFLADPRTGLVGARLLYPDGVVQHAGVLMGMSGLCDHAHRHLPGDEPGYMHRAVVSQELSAVTAACMLVRRALFEQVGGLDEGYPSAFNDVDLALRVGETGHAIVYAAQAELYHHELKTYGSHYAGERAAFQDAEVKRMRRRWKRIIDADPFHNPNLDIPTRKEWSHALPPRLTAYNEAVSPSGRSAGRR